jgi:hypothetical protein
MRTATVECLLLLALASVAGVLLYFLLSMSHVALLAAGFAVIGLFVWVETTS